MRKDVNISNDELLKIIKKQTGIKHFREEMLAVNICFPLSRLCSIFFIRHNIIPNQITLLMIIFGVVGSILFSLPNIYCKIIGYLFWFLWFTMDCSDGQVARYTKTYSKYGTEMDYIAHLIDHPCMNLAIWATFIQMNIINPIYLSLIFIINISIELILRNIIAFDYFHMKLNINIPPNEYQPQSIIKYIIVQSSLYPTMIICFSWVIILGYIYDLNWILYLYFCWLIIYIGLNIKSIIKKNIEYYNS